MRQMQRMAVVFDLYELQMHRLGKCEVARRSDKEIKQLDCDGAFIGSPLVTF